MTDSYSFGYFLNILFTRVGIAGVFALILGVLALLAFALVWRHGAVFLMWVFLLATIVGTAVQMKYYRESVLPESIVSVVYGARWLFLIALMVLAMGRAIAGKIPFDRMLGILGVWSLVAIISSVTLTGEWVAFQRAIAMVFLIGGVVACYGYVVSSLDLNNFMRGFFVVAVVCAGLVIASAFAWPGRVFAGGRFRGFLYNPNSMGWLAATMFVPCAWTWLDRHAWGRGNRVLGLCVSGFYIICLLLTGSRASLLMALPVFLCLIFIRGKSISLWLVSLVLGIAVFLGTSYFLEPEAAEHILSLGISDRVAHSLWALSVIKDSPFIGHGFGYADVHSEIMVGLGGPATIHNGYLITAIDLGSIGVAILFIFIIATWKSGRAVARAYRQVGASTTAPTLLLALFVGHLLNATVEGWLGGIGSGSLFMFLLLGGVLAGARHRIVEMQDYFYGDPESVALEMSGAGESFESYY